MSDLKVPAGNNRVMPYLILKDGFGFIEFAKNILSATEAAIYRTEDGGLMHGEIMIGDSKIMIGEASDKWPASPAGMFIYVADVDKTYAEALAAGASSIMEPVNQDYGRSGGIKDSWGNTWWITQPL